MAWKGMALLGNAWQWHGMERFENGMEIPMAWYGMNWKGMTMTWHGINKFLGLGLRGSFVSLCALTQKLGRNVK
jgi:hypothetical protein